MTWQEWWEAELNRIFSAWRTRLSPEKAAKWRSDFEAKHPWWHPKDDYGIKSHRTYRNNVDKKKAS